MEVATATQLYFYGRQLQSQQKKAEAIAIYRIVAKRFPTHWLGHLAQARSHWSRTQAATTIRRSLRSGSATAASAQ